MSGQAPFTHPELDGIADAMAHAGTPPLGTLTARLLTSGRSNLTAVLEDEVSRWVLRTPPRAGRTPSAHDVLREFRVTSGLAATDVPVARPVVGVDDDSLLGVPYAVWEFVEGESIQTREQVEAMSAERRSGVVESLVATLARLHAVDHVAAGLERFGRPDGYAERQFLRWSGQWDLVGLEHLEPLAREVMGRLDASLPAQAGVSVVHGDYRVDNTLLSPESGAVAAVVDWELSTIGDPLADVAMMCAYRSPDFDLVLGMPTAWGSDLLGSPRDLAQSYARSSGRALVDFEEHLALAHFKVAVIAAGIEHRRAAGVATDGESSLTQAVERYLVAAKEQLEVAA